MSKEWNHLTEAESRLKDFFKSSTAGVFVLKGKYGSGKSYFLRNVILKKEKFRKEFKFVSYTSVFGLNDLKSLTDTAIGSVQLGSESVKIEAIDKGLQMLQTVIKPFLGGVNAQVSARSVIWSLAHRAGMLLIIDDIDRRGSGLAIKEIIGFANTLVEHTEGKVRVILVLNEEEFDTEDKEVWDSQREKFIDLEFQFEPRPQELASEFVKDAELRDVIGRIHEALKLPNIRTMLKIESLVLSVTAYLKEHEVELTKDEREQAAKAASLFLSAGSDYSVSEITSNKMVWLWAFDGDESQPESAKKLYARAQKIEFMQNNSLDPLLIQFFLNGHISNEHVETFKRERSINLKNQVYKADAMELWALIYRSFRDTTEEFLVKAQEHVKAYTNQIRLRDLFDLVKVIDELGGNSIPVWEIWLEKRGDSLRPKQTEQLREEIPEELHKYLPDFEGEDENIHKLDPNVLFHLVLSGEDISEYEFYPQLAKWEVKDWITWLESTNDIAILSGIKSIIESPWEDECFKKIQASLQDAVGELVQKNPLNQLRAKRYFQGIGENA